MKRKLLFAIAALLCSVGSWAQSWTGGASNEVYLQNVGSHLFWGAANNWDTQASLIQEQQYVKLIANSDGTFKMESMVSNGGTNYYFNGSYMDGDPVSLTITSLGDGKYSIANGSTYYGWDGSSSVLATAADASSENFQWVGYTSSEIDELNATALSAATAASPVDASNLILDAKFGRNRRNAETVWTITASNKNLNGGGPDGGCAESFHSSFTLSQSLSKAPNGKYKLTAQAFYRKDENAGDNVPYIYITNGTNTSKSNFKVKSGSENDMGTAATSFKNGLYQLDDIYVVKAKGQSLSVGAKLEEETNLWSIWANFQLTYYGNAVEVYSPASFTSNSSATKDTWYKFSVGSAGWYRINSSDAAKLYYTQDDSDDADATASKEFTAGGYTFMNLSAGSFFFKSSEASTIKIEAISSSVLQNGDVVTDVFVTNPSFEADAVDSTTPTGWTIGKGGAYVRGAEELSNKVDDKYLMLQGKTSNRNFYQGLSSVYQGKYILSVNAIANSDAGDVDLYLGDNKTPIIVGGASGDTYTVAYEAAADNSAPQIKIDMNNGSGDLRRGFFDNFVLTYYSTLPDVSITSLTSEPMAGDVRAALDAANTAYTGSKTVANYNALQTAIINAKVSIAEYAANKNPNADWTGVIVNPSFTGTYTDGESGTTQGWTITGTSGNRQFNAGAAESWRNNNVVFSQVIKNLPAGTYKLTAQVDNCHEDANVALYATCNETTYSTAAPYRACTNYATTSSNLAADESLCLTTLYLKVEEGKDLTIGVKDESTSGGWMIFDNFKLTYDPTLPESVTAVEGKMNGTVESTQTSAVSTYNSTKNIDNLVAAQAAIYAATKSKVVYNEITTIKDNYDTKAAALDATGQAAYAAGTSATKYTNGTYETASEAETAYHDDYIAAVKAQDTDNADMTDLIVNPSFEYGYNLNPVTGWTVSVAQGGGTGETARYKTDNDGGLGEGGGSVRFFNWTPSAGKVTVSQTIADLEPGTYKLSAYVVSYANNVVTLKAGETSNPITLTDGNTTLIDVTFTQSSAGSLAIEFEQSGTWFELDNFHLTLLASYYANAADYAALNAAISTATTTYYNHLGFETGDYAPYENIDALTKLDAANAIDQSVANTKTSVQTATTNLTDATWNANVGDVECVYNNDFSNGEWGLEGWNRPTSWGVDVPHAGDDTPTREEMIAAGASTGHAYYNQNGSLVYGTTGHYTMPLKEKTIYTLTFKYASWEGGDNGDAGSNDGITVSVLNDSNEGMDEVEYEENNKIFNTSGAFVQKTINFVTTSAGNYVLTLENKNNTVITDVSITKVADQTLTLPSETPYAAGTYPSVTLDRTFASEDRWYTLCAPFAFRKDQFAEVKVLNAVVGEGESAHMKFVDAETTVAAGTPCLVKPASDDAKLTATNVDMDPATKAQKVTVDGINFIGTFSQVDLTSADSNAWVVSNNNLYNVDSDVTVGAYRAYFTVGAGILVKALSFDFGDATGIDTIANGQQPIANGPIYNLAGQRVDGSRFTVNGSGLKTGIYIVNGKKVLVK